MVVDKDMQYAAYDTDYQRKESREVQDGDRNIKVILRSIIYAMSLNWKCMIYF